MCAVAVSVYAMADSLIMVAVMVVLWLSGSATTTRGMLTRVELLAAMVVMIFGLDQAYSRSKCDHNKLMQGY